MFLTLLIASITPGLFLLWGFTKIRNSKLVSGKSLAVTFFFGMVATVPAALITLLVTSLSSDTGFFQSGALLSGTIHNLTALIALTYFVVGPIEETAKFLAVKLFAWRLPSFRTPRDGLIYAAAASFGFATVENVLYAFQYGPEVLIIRGPLSTLAHFVFGSIWGITLGLNAASKGRGYGSKWQLASVMGAASLHGTFNVFISLDTAWGYAAAGLFTLVGTIVLTVLLMQFQRPPRSPSLQNVPWVLCSFCDTRYAYDDYCPECRNPLQNTSPLFCRSCGRRNLPDSEFCTRCTDRFVLDATDPVNP